MPETQVGGIQIGGIQIGGAQFQGAVAQWFKQSENLFTVVFYAVVFVWTVFVDKLPAVWRCLCGEESRSRDVRAVVGVWMSLLAHVDVLDLL